MTIREFTMSAEDAVPQLSALMESLKESDRRGRPVSPNELRMFGYIVVMLQAAGYNILPTTWGEIDPQNPNYPLPYQVIAQINSVIAVVTKDQPPVQGGHSIVAGAAQEPELDVSAKLKRLEERLRQRIKTLSPLLTNNRVPEFRKSFFEVHPTKAYLA